MINFNSKFNLKAPNIGFFLSNDLKIKAKQISSTRDNL